MEIFLVSVLQSAHIKRFSVSRMWYFQDVDKFSHTITILTQYDLNFKRVYRRAAQQELENLFSLSGLLLQTVVKTGEAGPIRR